MNKNRLEHRHVAQYGSTRQGGTQVTTQAGGGFAFSGYCFEWGALSENLGNFREKIARGAFSAVIASGKNVVAILDHEKRVQNFLGSVDTGTLFLAEDDRGLAFVARARNTQAARDVAEIVRADRNGKKSIGVSFAFVCLRQRFSTLPDGTKVREVLEADLDEISLVVDPAYKSSEVSAVEFGGNRSRPMQQSPSIAFLERELAQFEMESACG